MREYERIAADLRARLESGEWPPGTKLPGLRNLAAAYGVDVRIVNRAVRLLAHDRYLRVRPKSGVEVLDRTRPTTRLNIGRAIHHDEDGYRYNLLATGWPPICPPTRSWTQLGPRVADYLDREVGTPALLRHRVLGPDGRPEQTTNTYLVGPLAHRLDVDDTGPGGWMQMVERELAPGPLSWQCVVSAGTATAEEAADLDLPAAGPVLRLAFVIRAHGHDRPIACDVLSFDGDRYHVEYPVPRAATAKWPPTPARRRNVPPPGND